VQLLLLLQARQQQQAKELHGRMGKGGGRQLMAAGLMKIEVNKFVAEAQVYHGDFFGDFDYFWNLAEGTPCTF
jgi:hypothetical protein